MSEKTEILNKESSKHKIEISDLNLKINSNLDDYTDYSKKMDTKIRQN